MSFELLIQSVLPGTLRSCCETTLPALLSPGNLGRLDADLGPRPATMLCLRVDRARFELDPHFARFAERRPVTWLYVDDVFASRGGDPERLETEALRRAVRFLREARPDKALVVLNGGNLVADGALDYVARALEGGAEAVMAPVFPVRQELLPARGGTIGPRDLATLVLASRREEHAPRPGPGGESSIICADWRPVGYGSAALLGADLERLADSKTVPRLGAGERTTIWPESSDDILLAEVARTGETKARRDRPEMNGRSAAADAGSRGAYRLLTRDGALRIDVARPDDADASAKNETTFSRVAPELGLRKRYQSMLDGYYRVMRDRVEAMVSRDAYYVGHAARVVAPMLARQFDAAFTGDASEIDALTHLPSRRVAAIVHVDGRSFRALACDLIAVLARLLEGGAEVVLVVETPETHDGVAPLEAKFAQLWFDALVRIVGPGSVAIDLRSTQVDFFEGHPGFAISIGPREAGHGARPSSAPAG